MTGLKRLVRRNEFNRVYKNGKSVADRILVLYYLPNGNNDTRVGFTVGKKVGKAVTRNRYKRILREICRLNSKIIKGGYDCVLIARPAIVREDYEKVEKSFLRLYRKAGLVQKERKKDEAPGNSSN